MLALLLALFRPTYSTRRGCCLRRTLSGCSICWGCMGGAHRACAESPSSFRTGQHSLSSARAESLPQSMEIVSKVGDDIRIYFEDSGCQDSVENGFWISRRRHGMSQGPPGRLVFRRRHTRPRLLQITILCKNGLKPYLPIGIEARGYRPNQNA